jgi:SAM-dependent methyltransferase
VPAAAPPPERVCPLLERRTATRRLPYAPEPWRLRQCLESGFVYLENPPGYAALEGEHAWEASFARESQTRREAEPRLQAASAAYGRFRREVLRRNKVAGLCRELLAAAAERPIHILDLGCGEGQLLERIIDGLPPAVARRSVPHGIELSPALAARAAARLSRLGGSCEHANALVGMAGLSAVRYRLILLASFLEHEIEPLPVLRRCRELLRDDGQVVVKVPNFACWNRRLRGARWCGFRWPDHVNYFTPATLRSMAERAGFAVLRMRMRDRHPLSDSLYAVLGRTRT